MVPSQLLFNRFLIDGSLISVPCLNKGHILMSMLITQIWKEMLWIVPLMRSFHCRRLKRHFKSKMGKTYGVDGIPSEVLRNRTAIYFLHVLFNRCFDKGVIPSVWGKCILKPITKSSSLDPRYPLLYKGISLASALVNGLTIIMFC